MFVVFCYDVDHRRVAKVRKTALKYLRPVQRSVFEGELTDRMLNNLKRDLERLLVPETDTAMFYTIPNVKTISRLEIGNAESGSMIF